MSDELPIVIDLMQRAEAARAENTETARCDARYFEQSAALLTELVAALALAEDWIAGEGCLSEPFNAQQQKVLKPIRAALSKARGEG